MTARTMMPPARKQPSWKSVPLLRVFSPGETYWVEVEVLPGCPVQAEITEELFGILVEEQAIRYLAGYQFVVTWQDMDRAYVGTCSAFPSLSYVGEEGDPMPKVRDGIRSLILGAVSDMLASGEEPPEPHWSRPPPKP